MGKHQRQELEESIQIDAARYRWLRQQPNNTDAPRIDVVLWTPADESANEGEGLRMEALDDAVDAAMKTANVDFSGSTPLYGGESAGK